MYGSLCFWVPFEASCAGLYHLTCDAKFNKLLSLQYGMHMVPCGLMSFVLLLNSFSFCFTVGVVCSDLIAGQSFVFMIRFSAVLWWRNTLRLLSVLLSRSTA